MRCATIAERMAGLVLAMAVVLLPRVAVAQAGPVQSFFVSVPEGSAQIDGRSGKIPSRIFGLPTPMTFGS